MRGAPSVFIILAKAAGGDAGGNWVTAFAVMSAKNTLFISCIVGRQHFRNHPAAALRKKTLSADIRRCTPDQVRGRLRNTQIVTG